MQYKTVETIRLMFETKAKPSLCCIDMISSSQAAQSTSLELLGQRNSRQIVAFSVHTIY